MYTIYIKLIPQLEELDQDFCCKGETYSCLKFKLIPPIKDCSFLPQDSGSRAVSQASLCQK